MLRRYDRKPSPGSSRVFRTGAALLAVTALLLCGCAQGKTGGSSHPNSDGVTTGGSKTVLTVAARSGSHADVINSVKKSFEESNRCIVEVIEMDADELRKNVEEDAKNAYGSFDLVMIDDPFMPEYIEGKVLYNLTSAGYKDDPDFVEKSLALGKAPYAIGATYALPFTGNVQLLFYNSSIVGGNTDVWSWDGILAKALAAKMSGKKGYLIRGQAGNPIVSDFLPILWACGGDIFDSDNKVIIDSEEGRNALNIFLSLMETGGSTDQDGIIKALENGEAAYALGWPSWFLSGGDTAVSYERIPDRISDNSARLATGEIGNWMLGVTANTVNPDLAIKLLIYLTSEPVQREAIKYGGIPTRTSIFRDEEVLEKYPHFETIYEGTVNSRVRPRTVKWSEVERVFGEELSLCIEGKKSIDDTLMDAQKAVEKVMEEE